MTDAASTGQTLQLPPDLTRALDAALAEWQRDGRMARLWARDAALWTGADEARWMGWLDAPGAVAAEAAALAAFGAEVRGHGFADALLLGMGGSSLCPEVFAETFEPGAGAPRLHVLDSTDPAQVARVDRRLDADRTLFIVASKSGSTLEPNVFHAYFFERLASRLGRARAAARFVAITDPGSSLERLAASEGFLRTFAGVPSIGGRFSALSNFGMVPAAVMGLDVAGLAARAAAMARACAADRPVADNPGARLGLALGLAARAGRDKVTLIASPAISDLGAWLEQLIAESTGKQGKALIPVAGERTGPPEVYGDDRVFVHLRLAETADAGDDARVDALARAGHPVVRIGLADRRDLAAEFFRWEIATAVAGAVLGINPFDQPDVEASKVATRRLTDAYEDAGALPDESPIVDEGGVKLFTDEANARDLLARAGSPDAAAVIRAHLARLGAGDYFALLAYVDRNASHAAALETVRHHVRDHARVATCLGFGPRFLHSTGQAYKGGPNSGVFLQVTCDDAADLPIPGRRYTFGVVKAAQARGDFEVLAERGRRALRVHLGPDVTKGLETLKRMTGA
jgi:transaldolase/glucose-6-phosphate isomerase